MCVCFMFATENGREYILFEKTRKSLFNLYIFILIFVHAYTRYIVLISFVPKCEPPVRKVLNVPVRKAQLQGRNEQCRI